MRALDADPDADPADKKMLADMKAGKLVPDTLIYKLAFQEMETYFLAGKGVVLDGAIRNVQQATDYQTFFQEKGVEKDVLAIELQLSDEDAFVRLTKRKICSNCGYIRPYDPTAADGSVCSECDGELQVRADDDPAIIQKRIEEQGNEKLLPIAQYYTDRGLLVRIDATKTIEEIENSIQIIIEQ